ncbi:Thiamine-monophosphate kinase [Leucobacter soli]|uniref:Thiamine-monophosphate kinase n=1 Tax=Leucobacter soli TaxID=2812850 RepID=A0A916NWE7_9MICO|nr:thiamine-phosphate kinase [Leucobacter soli]CAG7616353.1 Thiamine-monophosphate kinase [Leucobacter soli]
MRSEETVGALGESEVLRRILARLRPAEATRLGPGDDCAVLAFAGEAVVTSDMMIEGPDFRLAWHSGFELGWKLAATNLSDVAAMGARPTALTAAVACPADTPVSLLEVIAEGLDAACTALAPGCGVVGGDLSRAPVLTAAITALGQLEGRPPIRRDGARPGDVVAYAGALGLAGIGLSLLFAESADEGVAHDRGLLGLRDRHPAALRAQLAPEPPIALGLTAADGGATAMLDVSDGLSIDAARIARASGVSLDLDPEALAAGFGTQKGERVPLDAMLHGGEDHGLLAAFPPEAELPAGFLPVGAVRERVDDGAPLLLGGEPGEPRGWDPFTVRPPGS